MRGCIKFSDGSVLWFTEDNYVDIIGRLDEEQKQQLVTLLRSRLGPSSIPVDVDPEVYSAWYEDTHRKDVILGGGSGSEPAKVNKKGGKKFSVKDWHDKSDGDRNIVWLRNQGFKKRWDRHVGYMYRRDHVDIDLTLLSLDHELFKVKITEMMEGI